MAPPSILNRPRSRVPTGINRPGGDSPSFSGYSAPRRPASSGGSSPGSGYTPGGDSFKNYSQADQNVMFNQAGGKDKFIQMAGNLEQKYQRPADYQRFLDKSKQYFAGQSVGGKEVRGADGIMRLQMSGADVPMRNAQGQQILSMMQPELTAQAPTLGQFFGDMAGGVGNLLGAAGEFVTGGGMLGRIVDAARQKFSQGKEFMSDTFNPGDINQRVDALSPEQRAEYFRLFTSGVPYQQAFQQASGQPFANGGIATLN